MRAKPKHIWHRYDLARTKIQLGSVWRALGNRSKARSSLNEARTILDSLTDDNPEVPDFQAYLAECCVRCGELHQVDGRTCEGLDDFVGARTICDRLHEQSPSIMHYAEVLGDSLQGCAGAQRALGDLKAASALRQEAERVWQDLAHAHPDIPRFQRSLARMDAPPP